MRFFAASFDAAMRTQNTWWRYAIAHMTPRTHKLVLPHPRGIPIASSAPDSTASTTPTSTIAPMGPGTPTYEFDVKMDGVRVHWAYDAGTNRYLRFQDGKVHVTAGAVPITVTNVVVMTCQHIKSPAEPRSSVPVTVGSGRVVVYSGGKAHAGTWLRAVDTDPWTFVADDGTPIYLAPGTTFVELSRG